MAWRCSGKTNKELVNNMWKANVVKEKQTYQTLVRVDRADFVNKGSDPYQDAPQSIGWRATISAPHMHAHALDTLLPLIKQDSRILDVGSGSGVLCAAFARLAGPKAKVVGVDHIKELVDMSLVNLAKNNKDLLDSGRVEIHLSDGFWGWEKDAPYDAIHVGAAPEKVPPDLLEQLASPGRMVIPVGPQGGSQIFWQYDKDASGKITKTKICGVRYVPLIPSGKKMPVVP